MKSVISQSFSVTAIKDAVSIDYIEHYYLTEATGSTPDADDTRWQKVEDGGTVPVPTSAAPYLWHKYIIFLTDGSSQDPIIEFCSSMGQNGIDYDLVPSTSSIIKAEDGTLTPTTVTCSMIKRNADGTAETLDEIPDGYSISVFRDSTEYENYVINGIVQSSSVTSVMVFVLKYGSVVVERHNVNVIAEGTQGLNGRGIQSQDVRFMALTTATTPETPTDTTWASSWTSLDSCGYSATNCYLYKAVKTVYLESDNSETTVYYVEGPTVWGQDGTDGTTPFLVDIDNEMTAVAVDTDGSVTETTTLSFGISAWYGTTDVISNCSVAATSLPTGFSIGVTNSNATVTVTIASGTTLASLTEITFTVTHATYGTRSAVFSIATVKAGSTGNDAVIYQLLPSASQLSVARTTDGGYNPSTVSLSCGYTKREGNNAATTVDDATDSFDGYYIHFRRYSRSTDTWGYYYNYHVSAYRSTFLEAIAVASYSKVEFVLSTTSSNLVSTLTGIIDRETVPIVADGLRGTDGDNGDDGNGIDTVSYARMFTMAFAAPSSTDSGWQDGQDLSESSLSQTNRFLWERRKITYTQTSDIDYEIYLIAQYNSGIQPNLLEDTAFLLNEMDAWDIANGEMLEAASIGLENNAWQQTIADYETEFFEMLRQYVISGTDMVKLKPSTWYTLSFYAAQDEYETLLDEETFNGDGDTSYCLMTATYHIMRIEAGQTLKVKFTGYVNDSSSVYMRCKMWTDSLDGLTTNIASAYKDITSASSTTVTVSITNEQSSACTCNIAAYMYKADGSEVDSDSASYTGYCSAIVAYRGQMLDTYLTHSSSVLPIDTTQPFYVDGQEVTATKTLSDGTYVEHSHNAHIRWQLSATATRHSLTFRTSAFSSSSSNSMAVLFRQTAYAHSGWISMPKLEENTSATAWIENSSDRYASDFQHVYCGDFVLGNTYMYANGVRHVVTAPASASSSTKNKYRMKQRTTSSGYVADKYPYDDTDHWEEANYLKFVATDLLLAEEAIVENLTVTKVKSKNNNFFIEDDGTVRATGGVFANVTITSGSTDGQHIALDADTKSISVFDENNNEVISIEGNVYDMDDVIPESSGADFTLSSTYAAYSEDFERSVSAMETVEREITSGYVQTTKLGMICITHNSVSFNCTVSCSDTSDEYSLAPSIFGEMAFLLRTYSDAACSTIIEEKRVGSCYVNGTLNVTDQSALTAGTIRANVAAGYHKVFGVIDMSGAPSPFTVTYSATWIVTGITTSVDAYASRHFANGLVLSRNTENYFAVVEDNGYMNFAYASNGHKIAMTQGVLSIDGANQPIVVYAARVTDDETSSSTSKTITGTVLTNMSTETIAVTHTTTKGRYILTIPASFGLTPSNSMCRAYGYGMAADASDAPIKATVTQYSSNTSGSVSVVIYVSDDDSPNYGGFYFEIIRFG